MALELRFDEFSAPLSRRMDNESPGFAQQGSVDWVALSGGAVTFTIGVLQRLSGSSLDAYTVTVGHALGFQFRLSRVGKLRIGAAIANMKAYAGLQEVLWLGFGMKHPARAISVTDQGATLVALCAAFGECFLSTSYAAEILNEMVLLNGSLDNTPAVSQWQALIKSCSGILTTTTFPLCAEKLMGLGDRRPNENESKDTPEPKSIAMALNSVAKVSKEEWTSVTIYGGREAKWIGAVAEWLFGLTITITDASGELLHTSCSNNQTPQIRIVLRVEIKYGPALPPFKSLQIADRTFHIPSVELMFGGSLPDGAYGHYRLGLPQMNGRVAWDRCLSASFDINFKKLMERPDYAGQAISSAARMFRAIATPTTDVPLRIRANNVLYLDASFGTGLIQTALHWFPELLEAKAAMEEGWSDQCFAEARKDYRASIELIKGLCHCHVCHERKMSGDRRESGCQVVLVETIILLCRLLSGIESVANLCPMQSGIRKLYNFQASQCSQKAQRKIVEPPGLQRRRKDDTRPPDPKFVATTMDNFNLHMQQALCLFTGCEFADLDALPRWPSAISVRGVCVYLNVLRTIPDSPPQFGLLHVCPGQIQHRNKVFSYLTDNLECTIIKSLQVPSAQFIQGYEHPGFMNSTRLTVRETVDQLFLHYEVYDVEGQATGLKLEPHILSENMVYYHGRVFCGHPQLPGTDPSEPSPEILARLAKRDVQMAHVKAPLLGRCYVLDPPLLEIEGSHCAVLRDRQTCVDCCILSQWHKQTKYIRVISPPDPQTARPADGC